MKRSILFLLCLLSAVPASSQVKPPLRPGPPRVKLIDRWTKELGLSPAQRTKIDGIFKSTSAQTKQILGNKKLSRGQQREQVTRLHEAARTRALAVLTPAQRQKMTQLDTQRGDERRRRTLDKMSPALSLSAAQKAKILAAWKSAAAQSRAVRDNASLTPDQKRARVQVINADTRARMSAILTPSQRAKMDQMRARQRTRPSGALKGGPRGGRAR